MTTAADDDDDLQLSSSTLAALQTFMTEREEQQKRFEALKQKAEDDYAAITSMDYFEEDWQQSQFWYDDSTATALAEQLLDGAAMDSRIAVVSAPTVFVKVREMKAQGKVPKELEVRLLEYDQRFEVFGDDFTYYDFENPLKGLPADWRGSFDRVLVDPPFLSEDCQTKTALTVRWMLKPQGTKVTLCTGERMRELVEKLYKGLQVTGFEVRHQKGLSNEFRCYTTFESDVLKWTAE